VTFINRNNAKTAFEQLRYVNIDGNILNINWKKDNPRNLPKEANLYINNIDLVVDEKFLADTMKDYGEIASVFIRRGK